MKLTRRDFLKTSTAAALATGVGYGASLEQVRAQSAATPTVKRWYKGNMHQHCQWSDGDPMPEYAIDWYKSRGYDFVCPSDHNIFQANDLRFTSNGTKPKMTAEMKAAFKDETSLWKPMQCETINNKLTQKVVDQTRERFGADSVRIKKAGGLTFVRMKSFDELVEQFAEDGKFLLIPGFEQTGSCPDKRAVHMNFIGVRKTFKYIKKEDPVDTLRETLAAGRELYADSPFLFTANHPLWKFYDISPTALIANPDVRFFELNNNGIHRDYAARDDAWEPEHFWDAVNAFRALADVPLLLGMGSDDRHGYPDGPANKGWTVARAAKLDWPSLLEAFNAGDFYSSNGLDFAEINFDGKTLSVKIDVKEEGDYRIEFKGTKKNFDKTRKTVAVAAEAKKSADRLIETFSPEVGTVLETVEGTEGSYTLKPDDLYVRAKIVKLPRAEKLEWRTGPAAWTQPYRS